MMDPYKPRRIASILDKPVEVTEELVEMQEVEKEDAPVVVEEEEEETVPEGTVKEILAWVGDNKDRVILALEAENAKESPRKGLVSSLEELK